ncbi:MAG TPA: ATPase, T2SS/T4P/T4SS family, partial [Gaiellaceae bacterium]
QAAEHAAAERAKQAEHDRVAKEKAEAAAKKAAEREAKARAKREAREAKVRAKQAERDRVAREKAEAAAKQAAEREAVERAKQAERDRVVKEKAEAAAKQAAEHAAAERAKQAERDRVAKEKAQREAAERAKREAAAEAERAAKEAARAARETAQRKERERAEQERAEREARKAAEHEAAEQAKQQEHDRKAAEKAAHDAKKAADRQAKEHAHRAANEATQAAGRRPSLRVVDLREDESTLEPASTSAAEGASLSAAATSEQPRGAHRPIGELLVARGVVTKDQVADALAEHSASGKRLGSFLVDLGLLHERDVLAVLAEQLSLDVVDLRRQSPEPDAIAALSEVVARDLTVVPLRRGKAGLQIAVADPLAPGLLDRLQSATGARVELLLAPASDIRQAIENSYKATARVGEAVRAFEVLQGSRPEEEDTSRSVVDANAPIVQVVNLLLEQAVRDRASDVHIEPRDDRVRIRNRTDGALHEVLSLPASMAQSLVSRIKIMSDMNIVERRRPQDGQFAAIVAGRDLDVRVATTSTVFGEKCVL